VPERGNPETIVIIAERGVARVSYSQQRYLMTMKALQRFARKAA
jgi:hypothetical protein